MERVDDGREIFDRLSTKGFVREYRRPVSRDVGLLTSGVIADTWTTRFR